MIPGTMPDAGGLHEHIDVIIIGSGAGGSTLAYALRDSGLKVLVLERGVSIPKEPENWDSKAVYRNHRYHTSERWKNAFSRQLIQPNEYYWTGGKTKVWGAALMRLRERDFEAVAHPSGVSPEWPITYSELEPFYHEAERLYLVHGEAGLDPCEPRRSAPYPFPPLPESAYMHQLHARLRNLGIHPFPIPMGIDFYATGACIYCRTCDGYPCKVDAKSDAEVRCLQPALKSENVKIWTSAFVQRLNLGPDGRISSVEVLRNGSLVNLKAATFVVACGAIQSAALLLRSRCPIFPNGMANRSGLVGRNLMFHYVTGVIAIHPFRRNTALFQKSLVISDYYSGDKRWQYPMGILQLLGFYPLQYCGAPIIGEWINDHSIQLFALSEDLPSLHNRVSIDGENRISIAYRPTDLEGHQRLVKIARRLFRSSGYPLIITRFVPQERTAGTHACGTLRFGTNPSTSVLDPWCRSHDVDNLYVVDASFLPSSGGVNPGLTIIAQALRVGQHLIELRKAGMIRSLGVR